MIELGLNVLVFLVGFFILVKGADIFIQYVGQLGTRFGMKKAVVGLLLISVGTSIPELTVSLFAVSKGSPSLSIGNIIGSNIADIALFLGFAGVATRLAVKKNLLTKEIPLMMFSFVLLYIFMVNFGDNVITRIEGGILLLIFVVYMGYLFKKGLYQKSDPLIEELKTDPRIRMKTWKIAGYTVGGLAGLLLGSNIIVDAGITIATIMRIDEAIIGLTAIAVGTSIPEVTASIIALKKKEPQMAFGNIVGSTIFNVLLVGGLAAVIVPLKVTPLLQVDGLIMIIFSILLLPFVLSSVKLGKYKGYAILALYFAYLLFVLFR